MDSPEQERSSSSPSVKIDSVERSRSRRLGEGASVVLSDASSFFVLDAIWRSAGLSEGQTVDRGQIEQLYLKSLQRRSRVLALDYLARREHTVIQLALKLRQALSKDGFPTDIHSETAITWTLDALVEDRLLSDSRFAEQWVRSRIRSHPEGPTALLAGLRNRGVDSQIANRVIRDVFEEDEVNPLAMAQELVMKMMRRPGLTRRQVAGRLSRRGFAAGVIHEVLESAMWDSEGE